MQAEWEEEKGQWKEAINLYLKVGDVHAAADVICGTRGEGWQETLLLGRFVDKKKFLLCYILLRSWQHQ